MHQVASTNLEKQSAFKPMVTKGYPREGGAHIHLSCLRMGVQRQPLKMSQLAKLGTHLCSDIQGEMIVFSCIHSPKNEYPQYP